MPENVDRIITIHNYSSKSWIILIENKNRQMIRRFNHRIRSAKISHVYPEAAYIGTEYFAEERWAPYSLTESKSKASANASSRDCFRRRLNFISEPFLTFVGQATNPRIKSNAIRVSRSPERGKSNLGSGKGEVLKARAEVPASKWKTNHSENFRYAGHRTGRACRCEKVLRLFAGL